METGTLSKELKVAAVGYGTMVHNLVERAINEAMEKDAIISMLKVCDMSEEEYYKQMNNSVFLADNIKLLADSIKELQRIEPNEPTIEQVKKQIKYSKNPLEIRDMNRKLNQIYKNQRRR